MSKASVFVIAFVSLGFTAVPLISRAEGPQVTRTVLLRRAATVPGYEVVMIEALIPVGGREGRHTHPGTLLARVEQGTLTLDYEGKPSAIYKAGDSFFVDAGKVHEGINKGDAPVKVLATLVVKTGEPLTAAAK